MLEHFMTSDKMTYCITFSCPTVGIFPKIQRQYKEVEEQELNLLTT